MYMSDKLPCKAVWHMREQQWICQSTKRKRKKEKALCIWTMVDIWEDVNTCFKKGETSLKEFAEYFFHNFIMSSFSGPSLYRLIAQLFSQQ